MIWLEVTPAVFPGEKILINLSRVEFIRRNNTDLGESCSLFFESNPHPLEVLEPISYFKSELHL